MPEHLDIKAILTKVQLNQKRAHQLWSKMKYFRYLAPPLLILSLLALDWLNGLLHIFPDFESAAIIGIGLMPLSELYYLWQRPPHLRHPVELSVGLLVFHGGLGMHHFLSGKGLAALWHGGSFTWEGMIRYWIGLSAAFVCMMYGLRTFHKTTYQSIGVVKLIFLLLSFGGVATWLLAPSVANWVHETPNLLRWVIFVMMGGGLGFYILHLIEVLFLPEPIPPTSVESLIEEIAGNDGGGRDPTKKREP